MNHLRRFAHPHNFQRADVFSDAEKEAFKDPKYYKPFRHELESDLNVSVTDSA